MPSSDFVSQVQQDGFAIIPICLGEAVLKSLSQQFDDTHTPERNLLSNPSIRALAASTGVREIMAALLGPECFAVRGIFFNKTQTSNWKVVWHQDLTIAVRNRRDVEGFGPWTTKAGVLHVQPPSEILGDMLAIRLHLDESGPENAPLRVIPASHRGGRFSAEEISRWNKEASVTCTVPRGGALVCVHSCFMRLPRVLFQNLDE
jgi:Phytanoyl-CoA dioxygenase (PhyH)